MSRLRRLALGLSVLALMAGVATAAYAAAADAAAGRRQCARTPDRSRSAAMERAGLRMRGRKQQGDAQDDRAQP